MRYFVISVLLMTVRDLQPLLNRNEVIKATALSRATIDRREKLGLFPRRLQLSPRRVAWRSDEVQQWIASLQRSVPDVPRQGAADFDHTKQRT